MRKALRIFSFLLLIAGIAFLGYGGYQLYETKAMQNDRVKEAETFVSDEQVKDVKDVDEFDYDDFEKNDTIGLLYVPKLDEEFPIIEGTDEDDLKKGVGHYDDSGFPGENKQILLSGHRDTVFENFDELEGGDEFHIKMENGTFAYIIDDSETEIVSKDDTSVIDPDREDEVLTVSTCYPFVYVGDAPERYVFHAYPKK